MNEPTTDELKSLFHALQQEHAETRRHFNVSNEATLSELRARIERLESPAH